MKKAIKKHLLLEQLEDRIFLSASPLAAVGSADHVADSEPVDLHAHDSLALAAEAQVEQAAAVNSEHVKPVDDEQQETAGTENAPVKHASSPSQNKITDRQDQPANELHTGERTPNDAIEENVTAESQSSDNAQAADNQNTKTDTIDTVQGAEQQINAPGMQTDNHEMEVDEGTTNGSQASEGTATDTATISNENNNDYPVLTQGDANNDTAEEVIAVSEDMDNATLDQPAEQSELVAEGAATGIEPNTEFAGDEHISQIVFVDSSVTDHETLLNGIIADISANNNSDAEDEGNSNPELIQNDIRIITLDASQDEIQQITDTLSDYSELDAVHILSHGSNSSLRLGGTTINNDNLDGYSDQLSHWGESLNDDGDLLLYGCKVAEDGEGVEFIESVATLTGADVAASDDATGNNASGGDWDLEVTTGKIDVQILHDASGNWDGLLAPPLPTSLDAAPNTEPMINSEFHFTITFDNDPSDDASTDTGYGPFADVIIPHELEVVGSPTIFTNAISPEIYTWNGTGWEDAGGNVLTEHPGETTGSVTDTDLEMPQGSFDIGDKWYYIIHPFGSFTTGQPAIDVDFTARASTAAGAEVATGYDILHRAGFNYGDTATNEHGPIQEANTGTLTITPQVLDIHKINNAPEQQTVTGPNYPVEYTLRINIAGKETVNDVIVQDYLPEGAVYRGDVTITPVSDSGAPAITPVSTTEPTAWTVLGSNANDRLLELDLGDLTGVDNPDSGHTEWEVKYTVYFSDVDADGNPLLPVTGDDHTVTNESSITGQYAGNTVSDGLNSDNSTPSDTTIELASIVTYKDVAVVGGGDPAPNAILEWTIEVDISDYYAGGNIVLNDVFGDGQSFDTNFTPTITLHENGTSTSADFAGANYTVGTEDAYDGQGGTIDGTGLTQILFNVSDQFQTMGDTDGVLEGGFIADGTVVGADQDGDTLNDRIGGDGTYATITFRTVIDQEFDEFQNSGTGDSSVDLGDRIHNDVDVSADITDNDPATPDEQQEDHSSAAVVIEGGNVIKETYAVNGDTNYDLSQGVSSGDRITYRLRMELPLADFENLVVSDYLPLPVYDANELDPATDANDFDGTIDYAAGEVEFGPDHTLDGAHITNLQHEGTDVGNDPLKPVVSFDTTNNSISFDFGSYDADGDPQPVVIDLLLTVTIQNQAMVDGLMLTNQGEWSFNNTTSQVTDVDEIVQITLNEPDVHIVKGVVNTDNTNSTLGAAQGPGELTFNSDGTITITAGDNVEAQELIDNPVDADLTNADGSDLVTFAITVYNAGGDNAYDINVVDTMPTGFVEPGAGINLHVYDGTGALLVQNTDYTVTGDDFYANGEINFNNIALTGNSSNRGHDGGHDVFIITYQLQVDNETAVDSDVVIAGSDHDNTATIDFFTGIDNGTTDWTETLGEPTDNARVTIADPSVEKHLVSTEISDGTNANDQAVIGEEATYRIIITIPEGSTPSAQLIDTLDSGLTFKELTDVTSSSGDLTTSLGAWNNVSATPSGQNVTFDLGDLVNINSDDGVPETVTLTYTVFVNNSIGNQNGAGNPDGHPTTLDNSAILNFTGGHSNTADAEDITVIEPDLEVLKTVEVGGDGDADGDAGDSVTYTISIQHSGTSETDAYDVEFADSIPSEISITNWTAVDENSNDVSNLFTLNGQDLSLTNPVDMSESATFTITVTGTLAATVTPGTDISNTANITWQSLDAGHANDGVHERTGDGGVNDYAESNSATVHVDSASVAKTLLGTEINDPGHNENNEAIIGELATYQVVITVPEGQLDSAELVDQLDAGLTFQEITDVTVTGDITTTGGAALTTANITTSTTGDGHAGSAQTITFNLGDLVNGDDNSGAETITIRYTALVENFDVNDRGDTLNNAAHFQYEDAANNTVTTNTDSAADITILESQITTTKHINNVNNASVEVGDIVTYTVELHNSGDATAYEVTAVDTMAQGTTYYTDTTHTPSASAGGVNITDNGNGTLTITSSTDGWDIAEGDTITVTYYAMIGASYFDQAYGTNAANPVNSVDADWSSNDNSGSLTTSGLDRIYDDQVDVNGNPIYTVDGNQDVDTARFNLNYNGSIGDLVFFDADNSGTNPGGDVGISGVDVTLTADLNGDDIADFTQTVRTGANGLYHFNNLAAFDSYTITVDTDTDTTIAGQPAPLSLNDAGYHQTFDSDGVVGASANTTTNINLAAGATINTIDFGYAGQNTVGDVVWWDANGDGIQDNNEGGLNNLTVTLHADIDGDGDYEYTADTTTATHNGVDGWYSFGDYLPGGYYYIEVTQPAGSVQTYDIDSTSPGGALDNRGNFTLTADNDRDDIDFGYRGTGSLGDFVWFDADADTNQDDGANSGLANVTLNLSADFDNDGTADYTTSTTTANDGSYSFGHLLGGAYTITVDTDTLPVSPTNWAQTFDVDGTGTANSAVYNLNAGQVMNDGNGSETVDFGYTGTGSLGDTVWYDSNGNGAQEAGEFGLAGVTVTISADVDGDGIIEYTDSAVTDGNGNYQFDHLPAADYTVSVTNGLPAGATPTYDLDSATSNPDSTTVYTLHQGEHTDRVDFGYTGTGSIGDTVWNDIDGDGIQDAGENGFENVTITLTDAQGHTITTTTDADGHYSFDNLFLGAYTVAVDPTTLPAGNSQTHDLDDPHTTTPNTPNSASVTLDAANPVNNDVDFGYNSKGTIGDTIWYDANADGIQDADELGLAGVTVTLTGDTDGDGNPDTVIVTTDAHGHYLFDQLTAGDYTITISDLPDGMAQTADPDGVSDNSTTLTLAGGETNLDQDFGYTGTGSIGDTIWSDADGNGHQNNGETGLAGVTVTLRADLNNDGIIDTVTTTTDSSGNYHFDHLPADNYTIIVDPATLPPGMQQTADPDGTNDNTAAVTLTAGETNIDQDFGYQQTGTIGDTIWYDADGDGVQDAGELGLNDVTVTLTNAQGNTVATTTTGSDGQYLFDNLSAGDYTITLTDLPNGMTPTADPDGGNDNTSQITIGGTSPLVNLDQDFGYTGTGSIGDTIWNDTDGDGTQNGGETGLAGVSVTLSGDFNGDGTPDTVTVITDANGQYHFDRLPEGQYTITVDPATLPPGMQQTGDPDGGNDNSASVVLTAGETNNDQDFGYQQTGTIGDTIWFDADGDGIQDPGEPGLANVQVTLVGDLDGDGQADDTLTTVTDANGNYLFDRLPAGDYSITVDPTTLPDGMAETFDFDGTDSANTAQVTIGENEANLDVDFGYKGTGSIGDTIWFDADNDGIQDPGEAGIPGVTVTITGDFDNDGQADDTMTVTTGPDGTYIFPNLPAGEYDITVDPATLPGGMIPTGDPDGTPDNTTHLSLASGEINNDQDFGYTGTGSIGDQLWNDQNSNGTMDPGEAPLAGVQVCIGVDLDGDGVPDYRATTTTGADGTYLFDNLPAGSHSICVNPATLPPGIHLSFDPDGSNDNATIVQLGAGEHNTVTDFGYAYPPEPIPPAPFVPPTPPEPPVPPAPEPGFGSDPLLSYQQFSDRDIDTVFLFPFRELPWQEPMLPVSPVYTGHAEPGTTLEFTLYDVMGNQIGQQSVMADTAGNWLASFPGTIMFDLPHHMEISQTISSYNASSAGFFNMRTYFSPNFSSMVFSSTSLDVNTIFAYMPSTIMNSMHAGNMSIFDISWNGFNEYEFFAPSTQPAQTSH